MPEAGSTVAGVNDGQDLQTRNPPVGDPGLSSTLRLLGEIQIDRLAMDLAIGYEPCRELIN